MEANGPGLYPQHLLLLQRDEATFRRRHTLNARLKHVIYDLSNLMFNISLIAQEYARRNLDTLAKWERCGREGEQPVYQFPEDYAHPVRLAPEVAARIADQENGYTHKKYIAPKWLDLAQAMIGENDRSACTQKTGKPFG